MTMNMNMYADPTSSSSSQINQHGDMQQNYIEQYLDALSSSSSTSTTNPTTNNSNVSTIRAVVMKFLGDNNVFNGYDEIKNRILQNNKSFDQADEKIVTTLDLFSYGTYKDYILDPNRYLQLNEAQLSKLRQLSALQLIQNTCLQQTRNTSDVNTTKNMISYNVIQEALNLGSHREVEQILCSCIGMNVLNGKLSQKLQAFIITKVLSCRDVRTDEATKDHDSTTTAASSLLDMLQMIQSFGTKLNDSNLSIQQQKEQIQNEMNEIDELIRQEQELQQKRHTMKQNNNMMGHVASSIESMDVFDAPSGSSSSQRRQKRKSHNFIGIKTLK